MTRLSTEERDELVASLHQHAVLGGPRARADGWKIADCDLLFAAKEEIVALADSESSARRALRDLTAWIDANGWLETEKDDGDMPEPPEVVTARAVLAMGGAE